MKRIEIYEEFKDTANCIKGELMAYQADDLTCTGWAVIKTERSNYTVYLYDITLWPVRTYPIRTYSKLKEAMAVFHLLRYNATYTEYPF